MAAPSPPWQTSVQSGLQRQRIAAALSMALSAALTAAPRSAAQHLSTPPFQQWGEETLAAIDEAFWLPDRGLYAEREANRRRPAREPAYMWSVGVQITALAAGSRLTPDRHLQRLTGYIDGLQTYWKQKDGVSGYDVLPAPAAPDRYYDDNAWIVLALVEAFELTGDAAMLDRAEETLAFVLSGEDDKLGGGVYWRERVKASKNACSNAPTIVAALRLQQKRPKAEHLETAQRLYAWTVAKLQDNDGLFWDNIDLDGEVDQRKYSYNSALMIRANCLFHELTGEQRWLDEAQRIARAAETQWVVAETGGIRDGGRFAHMLLEAFLAVHARDHDVRWLRIVERAVMYLHDDLRNRQGFYPNRWDGRRGRDTRSALLIDQASAARAFLMAASVEREPSADDPAAD